MKRRCRGHNLLEMLVASFVFSMAVGSLTSMWVMHARVSSQSRYRLVANFLAQQVCEEVFSRGYWFIDELATSYRHTPPVGMVVESNGVETSTDYQVDVQVTSPGATGPGTKDVVVRVTWHEPNGDREVRIDTMLARVGG